MTVRPDRFQLYLDIFSNNIRLEAKAKSMRAASINEGIERLGHQAPNTLTNALKAAASQVLGETIPETPLGDRIFAHMRFVTRFLRMPGNGRNFHDVLYQIKVSDEILNPLRVFVTDKEFAKIFIKATVGDQYNVPTIDVIRTPDQIDRYDFPETCVVKSTHGSGQISFRINGAPLDLAQIKGWFQINYYRHFREANYKTLRPKIIIEPFIEGLKHAVDYKIFCVNGEPRLLFMNKHIGNANRRRYFDLAWNKLPYLENGIELLDDDTGRPANFPEMLDVARKLSAGFNFIRIDLYSDGKTCKVGELTNCHAAGGRGFTSDTDHQEMSRLLFG